MLTFDRPIWFWLLIPLVAVTLWTARTSLSGMGTRMRAWAVLVRVIVLAAVVAALAEPKWVLKAQSVRATLIVDVSRSMPRAATENAAAWFARAAQDARGQDKTSLIAVGRSAVPQELAQHLSTLDIKTPPAGDATNLGEAVRLAMAVAPADAANRLVLISDGNETTAGLLDAARAARSAGIPIDVLPARYVRGAEVMAERLIAPASARQGETVNLRVVLTSTGKATGRLSVTLNGTPVVLDKEHPTGGMKVDLVEGTNVIPVPITLPETGPMKFDAVYEPVGPAGENGDTLSENNTAAAVTFVGGEGRVLVLHSAARVDEAGAIVSALRQSQILVTLRASSEGWASLAELGSFEAVVMVNTPAGDFSSAQQQELVSYIHELGGGLVVVGGDESYGAGGWIGSPLAEALPIKLDPPQKRQLPRGALALVMHSCEAPQGNYYGRRCAEEAIKALSPQDYAGIIEFGWGNGSNGTNWVFPMSKLGDKSAALRAANAMSYGDMPDFTAILTATLAGMKEVNAGQKHAIIISDGDPSGPPDSLLKAFSDAKVSISTVAVFPHEGAGGPSLTKMQRIAKLTGGTYYEITDNTGKLSEIPQIFVKEAQTVKRSLIWEGDAFRPSVVDASSEPMHGIASVPPISGYIVAADREGLSQVVLRGMENDPILAQWQHGLGRVVTFTGDACGRWSPSWVGWAQFRAFWGQHVRWAMRPGGSPNMRVVTDDRGDRARVIIEALDDQGERLNFLRWNARLVGPDGPAGSVEVSQVGPGRYEANVPTQRSGSYMLNLGYEQAGEGGAVRRGSLQAAITKPFADEFRALRDNAALLEQAAQITGGRVLDADASKAALWSEAGLTMPVTLVPVGERVTLGAIALLLIDVALRRVRIDVRAIARRVAGLLGTTRATGGEQLDALRAAREKARAKTDRGSAPIVGTVERLDAAATSAGRKFEATPSEIAAASDAARVADVTFTPARTEPAPGSASEGTPGEGGLSRLKKAKKRAQDEIDDG